MHVIPFADLIKQEHTVRIADLSVVGVGIVSQEPLERGLACFEEPVGGHKFGIITWCKPAESGYRAGIHFVTLSQEKERYIMQQLNKNSSHRCLRDPEKIIESLLESIKPEDNG